MLEEGKLRAFIEYKKGKIDSILKIEARRLNDLEHARNTVFRYAIPISLIDAVAGIIAAVQTTNFDILLPVALFVILIFILSNILDLQKHSERVEIMRETHTVLDEIREQEIELLRRA